MTASTAPRRARGRLGRDRRDALSRSPRPVRLDCGRELHPVRVAYETYGALSPRRDNVIMVCHALSGDAHAAGFSKEAAARVPATGSPPTIAMAPSGKGLGWWDGMIGPGFVLCFDVTYC